MEILNVLLLGLILWFAASYGKLIATPVTPSTKHANLIGGVMLAVAFGLWVMLAIGGAA